MKWYDASSYCDESGGRLVQVKDEANSRYIANALTETLNRSSAAVKYWIDGKRSDEFSENFLDRQGNLVNYTNFDPSQKVKDLQGELCIEVSLATSQPSTGSGSNSPDNFGYDPYYHEAGPPLFNMKPCTASRMFLCEYDLKPSETPLDDAGSNKTYSPSHVGSCDDIIMLSALSKSILSSTSGENSNLWTEKEKSLLSQFTGIVSGHYITAPYKDNHNPSAPGLTYELKYCNIQETKSKLNIPSYTPQQKLRLFLALYRWSELEGVHSDGIQTLLHDNQFNFNGNSTFNGSCVFLYRDHWYTGPCCKPRYSMCEYPPEVAKEIANEQTKTKEKIKTISDDLKDVTSSLNGADISFSSESFETALGVLQSIVEITEEHREEVLEDTSLETLKDMMTDVLSLVDTLNNEDIMSDLESFQTSEMDNNVNFFVTIQAITSLSDIIADSVTQELVGNTVTKISYQTNSSEVHILSSKELELLETNQQMVYSPNTIAPGSEITISLPSHIREKANQKKVSIVYAAYSPDLYQTMDTMTVKMTPTMVTVLNMLYRYVIATA
nr:uncharacterized protein LOC100182427 isoform X2 [Ciona intestinalis]|eukprot:XP_026691687.1 uncharacterized protein LOC100182427 isoform X2 [Ciona intestinalis]